jgi:hypothetical protein
MLQGALSRTDNQKLVSGFSHFYQNNLILGILAVGYFFIVSTLSLPARLLLRKNMGERAFSVASFFMVMLFFTLFHLMLFVLMIDLTPYGLYARMQESTIFDFSSMSLSRFLLNFLLFLLSPFVIFMTVLFGKAVAHFKYHLARARRNVISYSFYRGDGIYFEHRKGGRIFGFEVNETILRMLVEPIGLFKFSFLILALSIAALIFRGYYPADGFHLVLIDDITFGTLAVSITLIISSIALFLEEFSIMQKGRDAILDMVDGELDMQQILAIKEKLKVESPKASDEKTIGNNLLN